VSEVTLRQFYWPLDYCQHIHETPQHSTLVVDFNGHLHQARRVDICWH